LYIQQVGNYQRYASGSVFLSLSLHAYVDELPCLSICHLKLTLITVEIFNSPTTNR
jgi:hypothetical protein